MAEDRDENPVLVARIDNDAADLLSVAEAEVTPCLAGIGGFVDAVAGRKVRPLNSFSAPDINHVRIRGRHREVADRASRLLVEDGCPDATIIGRLPDAAVVDADVEDIRLTSNARCPNRPPAPERPDHSPLKTGVKRWIDSLRADRACWEGESARDKRKEKDSCASLGHCALDGGRAHKGCFQKMQPTAGTSQQESSLAEAS